VIPEDFCEFPSCGEVIEVYLSTCRCPIGWIIANVIGPLIIIALAVVT